MAAGTDDEHKGMEEANNGGTEPRCSLRNIE